MNQQLLIIKLPVKKVLMTMTKLNFNDKSVFLIPMSNLYLPVGGIEQFL